MYHETLYKENLIPALKNFVSRKKKSCQETNMARLERRPNKVFYINK